VSTAETTPAVQPVRSDESYLPPIDLRDRWLAAVLAWLLPGAGHIYQRRFGKGLLFMVCILATFYYGLSLGSSNVVYASFRKADGNIKQDDSRYAYLCQVATGLPALPAIIQAKRMQNPNPKTPLWDGYMAPPVLIGQEVTKDWAHRLIEKWPPRELGAPVPFERSDFLNLDNPQVNFAEYNPERHKQGGLDFNSMPNELSVWHIHHGSMFDLGTVFTMIAGLLNVLVIFDAWGGPFTPDLKPTATTKPN
jgi:uncharacterized protein DUF6677